MACDGQEYDNFPADSVCVSIFTAGNPAKFEKKLALSDIFCYNLFIIAKTEYLDEPFRMTERG